MKLGITMEGGASRTVFSCGVTDCFLEENIMPDYFVGVSAGIAYGISYLSGQKGRNQMISEQYMADKRYMGLKYLFDKNMKTYYNIPFVFDEVPNKLVPFDYEAFAAYKGEVEAVVTNIHSGMAEYLTVPRDESFKDIIVASCSLPLLFRPTKVGKHYYLDGGVADSVPFEHAIKKGCDKNIVILTRQRDYVKKTERALMTAVRMYRQYPYFAESLLRRADRYNACMRRLYQAEKEGKVFVIAPKDIMGVERTERNPKKLHMLYEEGYEQAKESMAALKKYLEA